jgi:hypothetical protein
MAAYAIAFEAVIWEPITGIDPGLNIDRVTGRGSRDHDGGKNRDDYGNGTCLHMTTIRHNDSVDDRLTIIWRKRESKREKTK